MLTRWGKEMALSSMNNIIVGITTSATSIASITAKTTEGNNCYISPYASTATAFIGSTLVESGSNASAGVAVGSGDTPPTENDYTLENQITGLTASVGTNTTVYDAENNTYIGRVDYTISNNTGNTVVIKEIGRFVRPQAASAIGSATSSANTARRSVMVDRIVLSNPVTIPNGSVGVVRYDTVYHYAS